MSDKHVQTGNPHVHFDVGAWHTGHDVELVGGGMGGSGWSLFCRDCRCASRLEDCGPSVTETQIVVEIPKEKRVKGAKTV